ncbi:MAG: MucB/RseB C-terminal domain-containing protein [Gammaproteobacteria bacterium]|nr:MucB/RseB C-terminal domain-containing protein [Gammaproteobacteria bacterium]
MPVNKTSRIVLALFALTLVPVMASETMADESATDWLMKMSRAAQTLNYRGHFVYQHDGQMEAMEIVHQVSAGQVRERLLSLNGAKREIIRNNDEIRCYLPDENAITVSRASMTTKNFPALVPAMLETLKPFYRFALGQTRRIGGRPAREVQIMPADEYRYGHRFWADQATGLLVQAELLANGGEVLEQFMFTHVDIGANIARSELEPTTGHKQMVTHDSDGDGELTDNTGDTRVWQAQWMPRGFVVKSYRRAMKPMSNQQMTHIVLSDGLAAVSVFIEPARSAQNDGGNRMGAVNAWRRHLAQFQITVVGEVPEKTVRKIAEQMRWQAGKER